MKSAIKILALASLSFASLAHAQEVALPPQVPAAPVIPAAPEAPAAPAIAAAIPAQQNNFPALPPSNPCKTENILGYWKLVKVYEQPQGEETKDFSITPLQFVRYSKDTTYKYVKFPQRVDKKTYFNSFERKEGDSLQQFVVNDTGFVYFYNEGNVVDTQACFIVAQDLGEFKAGQMLMMPPAPQPGQLASKRLLKVYYNVTPKPKPGRKK